MCYIRCDLASDRTDGESYSATRFLPFCLFFPGISGWLEVRCACFIVDPGEVATL